MVGSAVGSLYGAIAGLMNVISYSPAYGINKKMTKISEDIARLRTNQATPNRFIREALNPIDGQITRLKRLDEKDVNVLISEVKSLLEEQGKQIKDQLNQQSCQQDKIWENKLDVQTLNMNINLTSVRQELVALGNKVTEAVQVLAALRTQTQQIQSYVDTSADDAASEEVAVVS